MQILLLKYQPGERGSAVRRIGLSIARAKHGTIIPLPESMSVELLDIDGDEVPPVFVANEDGTVTVLKPEQEKD